MQVGGEAWITPTLSITSRLVEKRFAPLLCGPNEQNSLSRAAVELHQRLALVHALRGG